MYASSAAIDACTTSCHIWSSNLRIVRRLASGSPEDAAREQGAGRAVRFTSWIEQHGSYAARERACRQLASDPGGGRLRQERGEDGGGLQEEDGEGGVDMQLTCIGPPSSSSRRGIPAATRIRGGCEPTGLTGDISDRNFNDCNERGTVTPDSE